MLEVIGTSQHTSTFWAAHTMEGVMNRFVLSMLLVLAAGSASAATCADQASDKKLAGAALKSFIGKCERDAKAQCEATAQETRGAG